MFKSFECVDEFIFVNGVIFVCINDVEDVIKVCLYFFDKFGFVFFVRFC